MRATTTLLLLLITGVIGYFVMRNGHAIHSNLPGSAPHLFEFKAKDADRIVVSGKVQNITLEKRNGLWWIADSVSDRANPLYTTALLQQVLQMESVETLTHDTLGKDGWKRAGLNGTSIGLEVFHGTEKLASCRVGGHPAVEDTLYLRLPERDPENVARVVRIAMPAEEDAAAGGASSTPAKASVKKDLLALLQTPPSDWRDPVLLRVPADAVRRMAISAGNGVMEFKRSKSKPSWTLVKPLNAKASDERVNMVLNALLHLEARPSAQEKLPEATPSTLPLMQVSLDVKDEPNSVELTLQPSATGSAEIQATLSNRPGFFSLPAKAAEIWKLQPNDLRDPHLAEMDAKTVNSIRIRSKVDPEVVLDKNGESSWMLKRFGVEVAANQQRVTELFNQMNTALIREFASDSPGSLDNYGLSSPFLELEWQKQGDDPPSILLFGQSAPGAVFAKYKDEPFVYRISPLLLTKVPTESLKWQALTVLSFNTMIAHRIVISEGSAPPINLIYDPDNLTWSGTIADQDITRKIDRGKADALLDLLANFNAETWVTERTEGYAALKNPSLIAQVMLGDPSHPDAPAKPHILTFAPVGHASTATSFYGRVDTGPDLFLITREAYESLTGPVIVTSSRVP